jgi:hypothetical protein
MPYENPQINLAEYPLTFFFLTLAVATVLYRINMFYQQTLIPPPVTFTSIDPVPYVSTGVFSEDATTLTAKSTAEPFTSCICTITGTAVARPRS